MKMAPTPLQVVATMVACGLTGLAMGHPQELPSPFRVALHRAVDGAARFWLWAWNQPADTLDEVPEQLAEFVPDASTMDPGLVSRP